MMTDKPYPEHPLDDELVGGTYDVPDSLKTKLAFLGCGLFAELIMLGMKTGLLRPNDRDERGCSIHVFTDRESVWLSSGVYYIVSYDREGPYLDEIHSLRSIINRFNKSQDGP